MTAGKLFKIFFMTIGILVVLAICGNMFQLRDPNQERIINPSNPIELPKVDVKR